MSTPAAPAISVEDLEALIREGVPLIGNFGIKIDHLAAGTVRMTLPYNASFVRPGGTVTGPAMFGLADVALYGAVLSRIGRVLLAVTSTMTITFLRRPAPAPVIAEARLLRLGRRRAYGEVLLTSEGADDPVAHVTGTYSIPPERRSGEPPSAAAGSCIRP